MSEQIEKYSGSLAVDAIKYFTPDILFDARCPKCGEAVTIDLGDGLIEYPEANMPVGGIDCDCGHEIIMDIEINLECTITIKKVA